MPWDPHLPINEQPDAKFRYAPWVLIALSIIAAAVIALVA